jgi:hypothetical protein
VPAARLRVALLVAAVGACVALVDLLGLAGSLAGLGALLIGSLLSRNGRGAGEVDWWRFLATGTALAAVGIGLSELLEVAGVLTAIGGALAVIGAILGWPDRAGG